MKTALEPEKRSRWSCVVWWLLYAALCGVSFVVDKCKDAVEERMTGKPVDDDDEDGDE